MDHATLIVIGFQTVYKNGDEDYAGAPYAHFMTDMEKKLGLKHYHMTGIEDQQYIITHIALRPRRTKRDIDEFYDKWAPDLLELTIRTYDIGTTSHVRGVSEADVAVWSKR